MELEAYVLHVTRSCNCACLYCYEKDKNSEFTWEEIQSILDEIIQTNIEKEFSIEFLGGEPMLAFDHIVSTVEYIESKPEINVQSFMITTNGTIVHDELITFMKKHEQVSFSASIDGTKFMNSLRIYKNGINTYDDVIKNLAVLQKEVEPCRISAHLVIHPYNVGYLYQGIKDLYDHNITSLGIGTVESTITIGKEYVDEWIRQLDFVSKSIISGRFKDASIDVLDHIKPATDIRTYIRDKKGKIVLETYGRSKYDLTHEKLDNYVVQKTSDSLEGLIQLMREKAYWNHQRRLQDGESNK